MLKFFVIKMIRSYQLFLSPLWVGSCRFTPSCSSYGIEAINKFGLLRGGLMLTRRLMRCRPWGGSGWDPVPDCYGSKR